MDNHSVHSSSRSRAFSRRRVLGHAVAATAGALIAGSSLIREEQPASASAAMSPVRASANGSLEPRDAIQVLLAALEHYPLVAVTERHMLQEWHDFITILLTHPDLPGALTDIVVEFGSAAYQDLADRFILGDQPVARADLAQIWRQVGDPAWNAPVYEQFFRTVRAANRRRPRDRRLRILLGQPPITMAQVLAHPHDRALIGSFVSPLDDHYAAVIEHEVLRKGRRALLVAGKGHLLRGLHKDGDPRHLNAAGQVLQRHPGALYVVDNLILPPGSPSDASAQRVHTELARRPGTVVAALAGTWLGATTQRLAGGWLNEMADRAATANGARYDAQADAVLYFGPGETLTVSQPDPAIYHWGTYPGQLRRASAIAGAGDQLANGLHWATTGSGWFTLFQ